eukprot:Gb_29970 [translate_table: standard]
MPGNNKNSAFSGFSDSFDGLLGGFGRGRSLLSNFLDKDPFDDEFFTRPFASIFESSSIFETDRFFGESFDHSGGVLDSRDHHEHQSGRREPVIEEVSDDDKSVSQATVRSNEQPIVELPDDNVEEHRAHQIRRQVPSQSQSQSRSVYRSSNSREGQPVSQSYNFQNTSVSYGGPGGAYYTSSTTRRTGPDGVIEERHQEEDSTTGNATKRITRGIHDKGHSVINKKKPDGRVLTVEALHNLKEDEVQQFDDTWEKRAQKSLPGWNKSKVDMLGSGRNGTRRTGNTSRLALPPTQLGTKRNVERPSTAKSIRSYYEEQSTKDQPSRSNGCNKNMTLEALIGTDGFPHEMFFFDT